MVVRANPVARCTALIPPRPSALASEAAQSSANEGTEDVLRLSARLTLEVSKSNYLEAGWQYIDLASEIREESEYSRNRLSLGWKTVFK